MLGSVGVGARRWFRCVNLLLHLIGEGVWHCASSLCSHVSFVRVCLWHKSGVLGYGACTLMLGYPEGPPENQKKAYSYTRRADRCYSQTKFKNLKLEKSEIRERISKIISGLGSKRDFHSPGSFRSCLHSTQQTAGVCHGHCGVY